MKRARTGFVLRWRLAVPVFAAIAAMAATAAPGAAQAAGATGSGGSATAQGTAARLAAAPDSPMPAAAPAVQACDVHCRAILYTGMDTHVYGYGPMGGRLIGGPGAATAGGVFGRGIDNALWQWAGGVTWSSLGGRLTSRPGVAWRSESIAVVVRGTDGAVWLKERPGETFWSGWRSLGGRVLAGSGPAAVYVGGTLYVLAVGTDRAVWVTQSADRTHWSGWRSLGGRVSGDLGAASPAPGIGIVFARGTDNAAWYNQFAGTTTGVTPGWHSLGGVLTSGVGGFGGNFHEQTPNETIVAVLGTDNRIWHRLGTWPVLGPWATGGVTS